ncbi:hypothetical protein LP316_05430 [Thalassotalea sp. LPB0316]|uniref:hypothetical protein n=1 Tax=Thalassotalea sp. LPB0316 TaxID=2769490 RepID=UPI0018695672|nr:hypothetical protein [Thalassotalea sp. LPB0316]QOL26741.1 hypothetical protein LP316_05430 [Thalassotalea sp. LPB0316]
MIQRWQQYCEKFLTITPREKYMIVAVGFVIVTFLPFTLFVEPTLLQVNKHKQQISKLKQANGNSRSLINDMELKLAQDPNLTVKREIAQYEQNIAAVDEQLLALTSELIDPVAMRSALVSLLNMHRGVSLLSFEVKPAQPLVLTQITNESEQSTTSQHSGLYKHEISLRLKGKYFVLRDYLQELESLKWKFFWQSFDYQLVEYPNGELAVTLYSLSTQKEFLGV